MAQGKVKFYNKAKAFGFITKEDGKDIFFHINDCVNNKAPKENDQVEFEINPNGKKGACAEQVQVI